MYVQLWCQCGLPGTSGPPQWGAPLRPSGNPQPWEWRSEGGLRKGGRTKLARGHWEQSASNNDKDTCASNGKKLRRQYMCKLRTEKEEQFCRKYEFEEAESGREEEWWGCSLALLPSQRWYMAKDGRSGKKQNTTDQSACSYWFHTSSTNCSYKVHSKLSSQTSREERHSRVLSGQYHSCLLYPLLLPALGSQMMWPVQHRDRTDTYLCMYVYKANYRKIDYNRIVGYVLT